MSVNIKLITQHDLLEAGCFNISEAIAITEDALKKHSDGRVVFPDKTSVIFDEKSQNRINCLPAGIIDENVYGMKWVSVFPENPHKYQLQNVVAVILLSELKNGFPIAFMEGTLCSNLRTAAVSAVAAKYLANIYSEVIGFIGAGDQAKTHLMTLLAVLPNINICRVSSRTIESEKKFIQQMKVFYPKIKFVSCGGIYQRAAESADIIVTAISGQEKILQADWISKGTFYCHVGGLEDDFLVSKKADKIVCDDWNVVKHRTQTISQMYKAGILFDSDIYANLEEIVTRKKKGRETMEEFIYFNAVGLSYVDVMLANEMYKKVISKNLGTSVKLQDKSMFDVNLSKIIRQ